MLEIEELEGLYEQVIEKIRAKMFLYNRDSDTNALSEYLKSIGMEDLLKLRDEIDKIDNEIVSLYEKRMKIAEGVARFKI